MIQTQVHVCPEARGKSIHGQYKGGWPAQPRTVIIDWAYTHSLTYVVPPQLTLAPELLLF
jgi:hypothetical protein